jgi:hypothetical protein
MRAGSRSTVCWVSTYHIDLRASNDAGFVLVKLTGRAQAETIIKLLDRARARARLLEG